MTPKRKTRSSKSCKRKIDSRQLTNLFEETWLKQSKFRSWVREVQQDSSKALCRVCMCLLNANLTTLKPHLRSQKHAANQRLLPFGELSEQQVEEQVSQLVEQNQIETQKRQLRKKLLNKQVKGAGNELPVSASKLSVPGKLGRNDALCYLEMWEQEPLFGGWVARVPGDIRSVRCTVCMTVLKAHQQNLLSHRRSQKHLMNLTASQGFEHHPEIIDSEQTLEDQTEIRMDCGKELNIAGYTVKVVIKLLEGKYGSTKVMIPVLDPTQINSNAVPGTSKINEESVKDILEIIEEPVDLAERKISYDRKSLPSHCLICNINDPQKGNVVDVFSNSQVTSHKMLPPFVVLGGALKCVLDRKTVHSDTICRRCFNLLDDIDGVEVQLAAMKMHVSSQYKNTLKEVGPPWTDIFESSLPVSLNPTERDISSLIDSVGSRKKSRGKKESVSSTGKKQGRKRKLKAMIESRSPSLSLDDESSDPHQGTEEIHLPLDWSEIRNDMLQDVKSELSSLEMADDAMFSEREIKRNDALSKKRNTISKMDDKERYDCPHCPKQYISKKLLAEHVNLHTGSKPFQCRHCDIAFPMSKMLRHHLLEHNDTETFLPYVCEQCDKAFETTARLDAHSRRKHGVASAFSEVARSYVCNLCGKALSTSQSLVEHTALHNNPDERPFQCELCGSTFRLKSNMLAHVRFKHNRERALQCDACGKAFASRKMLRYHTMSAHTGERPYACNECGASFFCASHLSKHKKMHAGYRPFVCDICGKTFSTRENIKMHMYTHTKIKPFQCNQCSMGFIRRRQLVSHIEQDHPGVEDPDSYVRNSIDSSIIIVEEYCEESAMEIQPN